MKVLKLKNGKILFISLIIIVLCFLMVFSIYRYNFNNNLENDGYCSLYVNCKTILNNMDSLNKDKFDLIPKDGIIYSNDRVLFKKGENVFDVLLREMKENKIHIEFSKTPGTNAVYIEGINNIYEFDCGELSGWQYTVNDEILNISADGYEIKEGDVIEFIYTCDLGRDLIE